MRVLHVLNARSGGATVSACELARFEKAQSSEVKHFAVYPGHRQARDQAIDNAFQDSRAIRLPGWNVFPGVDIARRLLMSANDARTNSFGFGVLSALKSLMRAWNIDLVTTNCAANIHGALAAQYVGLPHVWHIRERIGAGGSMEFRLDDRRLVHRIAGLSSAIATVSDYAAEPFRRWGADNRLEVVFDGVDVERFAAVESADRGFALRREWGISPETVLVGKVANVTATVKRHAVFLRAAGIVRRRHPEVRFVMVGSVPSSQRWIHRPTLQYYQNLRRIAAEEGLGEDLVWAGSIDDSAAIMHSIDVLAHSCDIEGFPRVVIEAMAAGKPVVSPDAGGAAEGVRLTGGGDLVESGSAEALAEGIARFVCNAELRADTGLNGQRVVQSEFSLEAHSRHLNDLYRISASRGPATVLKDSSVTC